MGIFDMIREGFKGSGEREEQKSPGSKRQPYQIGDCIGGRFEVLRIVGGDRNDN
ncbi:MAG: hypothetical protein SCARUB_02835 [Candidatus Scalindua rubra]|uniref:Uncharacterized protein n=1 Tax=Candidatus Scalindua rubra TaxID=1872076 RepID=A0A1E3X8U8_9BACT|nr:MAG: hypothetical protein SCARUB_02835 [Candidatus Scalindua rubra]